MTIVAQIPSAVFRSTRTAITLVAGLVAALCSTAAAQQSLHTLHAEYVTRPTGPNSDFSIKLTMSPNDVDIVGFDIIVGYDATKASWINITDNTGHPGSDVEYTYGSETNLSGVPYANKSRIVRMSALFELPDPINLAQINFRTSSSYSDPTNQFPLYVAGETSTGPGGLAAATEQGNMYIPTGYDSLEPESSVPDWAIY